MYLKVILALLLFSSSCFAIGLQDAACRVRASLGRGGAGLGSGTVVKEDETSYYVLTNAHVVQGGMSFSVQFFRNGQFTVHIPAQVVFSKLSKEQGIDFAVLQIAKQSLQGLKLRVIPMAPPDTTLQAGDFITGSGCPRGSWMQTWEARVYQDEGNTLKFNMIPEQGQSGSGILKKVGDHYYVVGIVTWRSDQWGGGVTVQGVANGYLGRVVQTSFNPDEWENASTPVHDTHVVDKATGKVYYGISTKLGMVFHGDKPPETAELEVRDCPGGRCPVPGGGGGFFGGTRPQQNQPEAPPGGPKLFEDFNDGIVPLEDEEIKKLKDKIVELEKELAEYKIENGTLKDQIEEINKKVAELEQLNNNLTEKHRQLEAEKQQVLGDVEKKKEYIAEIEEQSKNLNKEKEGLVGKIGDLQQQIKDKIAELEKKAEEKLQKKADENNIKVDVGKAKEDYLSGVLTIKDALLWLFGTIIVGFGGKAIYKFSPLPDWIDRILVRRLFGRGYEVIKKKVDDKPEPQPKPVDDVQQPPKTPPEKKGKVLEEVEQPQYINYEPQPVVQQTNVNIGAGRKRRRKPFHVPEGCDDYIIDFFKLKEKDGENVKEWAAYGILYRDAIEELRQGRLGYNNKTVLQGQKETATVIDNYVRDRFFEETTIQSLQYNNVYHEAMFGFLYKEAVSKLREGYFEVLGHVATANAIDAWVKEEFLRRRRIRRR